MNILRANLKHLYQRRTYLFLTIFFGAIAFLVLEEIIEAASGNKQGGFVAPVLWMFLVGSVVVSLPLEILTKPYFLLFARTQEYTETVCVLHWTGIVISLVA
ncbi:MAG: hypothetical protein KAS23_00455 [Anaerohalosphaera sp.]|nr:hypothetical protein [Anaerohalosphaera sp.]